MQTIADMKRRADQALFDEHFSEALQLYATMVTLQPGHLDTRLRVADALHALGETEPATNVYTALARNAALAGYPLRALVALKILANLGTNVSALVQEIARLYARESYRVGQAARRTLPVSSEVIDEQTLNRAPTETAALVRYAEKVAGRYERDTVFHPDRLMPIPVLSLLPEAEFAPAFDAVQLSRVRPDTWILRQGDPGTSFFVLARGSLEVTTARDGETVKLTQLSDGAIFGELVLLSDAPRSASVRALSDCDLLVFDRDRLRTAAGELQHLRPALQGFARDRLLTNVTQTSPLFRPLDPRQRVDLVRRFISVESGAGQRIIQEGDQGQGLYVVLRGTVDVSRNGRRVAQLGAADLFGEMSMIRREPTSASVLAGEHGTSLLFLHRDYFERLIEAVPELRGYFEQLSKSRLSELLSAARETDPPGEEIEVELLF